MTRQLCIGTSKNRLQGWLMRCGADIAPGLGSPEFLFANFEYLHSGRRGAPPAPGSVEFLYAYGTQANANYVILLYAPEVVP